MEKAKAILVPFGYPDYPQDVVLRFISQSEEMLKSLSIDLKTTKPVIRLDDVPFAAREIREGEFDFIIALIVSWVEAPNFVATLRDWFHCPILLWSHTTYMENGVRITLGPMPAAGVLRETLEEMNANFKFVYSMPGSDKIKNEITSYAKAARATRALQKARVGLFGYYSMGMYTGAFDHTKIRKMIGPEIIHLDQYLIVKRAEEARDEQIKELMEKAKTEWELSEEVNDTSIAAVMKVYLALKKLAAEQRLDALTVKCQYELSREYGVAPCIPLSMLGDELPCSCEGDIPLILSQLILHYLTGGEVTSYGDVHDVLDNEIIIAACGFAPLSMAQEKPKVSRHTALYEGLLNMSPYKGGKVTLARLASDKEGYKMHIATGFASIMPPLHEINCPSYAGMKIALAEGTVGTFMRNLLSQHYAIVYGHIKKELEELCGLLGIRVISNV